MNYLIVLFTQFFFVFIKTYNVQQVQTGNTIKATLSAGIGSCLWLVSTTVGVGGLLNGELYIGVCYIVSAMLGTAAALLLKRKHKK